MPSVEKGTICLIGAGGPVGAVVYERLKAQYRLRLADLRPAADFIQPERRPGWPKWSDAPEPPHEWVLCDVAKPDEVERSLEGCDAAINLTVNRSEPIPAFSVNVFGAYNLMRAAANQGLKRVIHTGPWTRVNRYESDFRYEYRLTSDAPFASGAGLYPLTKSLSLKVTNAFAEHEGLDVMTFLLSRLRPADAYDGRDDDVMISFSVSWNDLAEAFLCGLQAPPCPRPNETFFIAAPLPFEKYDVSKEKRLLGWEAKDRFERFHTRKE